MHVTCPTPGTQVRRARDNRAMPYRLGSCKPSTRAVSRSVLEVDGMTVEVKRKTMRNMYLRVDPRVGTIMVSAPQQTTDRQVMAFVRSHNAWIARQRRQLSDAPPREWTDELMREARRNLDAQIPGLLEKWTPIVGREPTCITLRAMRSRWGSCTPATGCIRLNLQLGLMEPRFLEYVLVHELTHFWERGHGAGFQRRMDGYLPGWRAARRDLNRETTW